MKLSNAWSLVVMALAACAGDEATLQQTDAAPAPDVVPKSTDNGALRPEDCPMVGKSVVGIDGSQIAGARMCRGITYDPVVNLEDVALDMYVPPVYSPNNHSKAIVFVHGGGWRAGDKGDVNSHQLDYLNRGYFVFSLNYRLSDYGPTANPVDMTSGAPPNNATAIQDVKTALQFIRATCATFIDTDGIVIWGFSAGAHLAVLAGASSNDEATHPELRGRSPGHESSAVKAVVAQSPALDLDLFIANPMPVCGSISDNPASCGTMSAPIPGRCVTDPKCPSPAACHFGDEYSTVGAPAVEHMLGAAIADPPTGVTSSATPLTFVDASDPPIYILAGKCDGTIPPSGARDFGPAAIALGADVTVKLVDGAGHLETMNQDTNPTADADVRAFLASRGLE